MSVQTQGSLADQTFAKAEAFAEGQASGGEVIALIDALLPAAERAREEFLRNSQDNPEITEDVAAQIAQAMAEYSEGLETLKAQAESDDREGFGQTLEATLERRYFVRAAQMSFQAYLEQGLTIHPQLNRVLIHVEYFAGEGSEKRHTLALLDGLPGVFAEIRTNLNCIDDAMAKEEAEAGLEELESRCDEFGEALRNDFAGIADRSSWLQNLHEELVAASDKVATYLAGQLQQDLAVDRTPLAPVNLVLALSDRILERTATPDQFVEGLIMADRMLVMQVPEGADEVLVEQVNQVRDIFERMANLANDPDPDQLRAEKEALTSAAQNLAMFAAVMNADDENLLDMVQGEGVPAGGGGGGGRGLPNMLNSLLVAGESFLDGNIPREDLDEAIKNFDQLITRTKAQAAGARDSGQGKQLQETLGHLQAASDAMWSLADSENPEAVLAQAEQAMISANETLKTVASR